MSTLWILGRSIISPLAVSLTGLSTEEIRGS